MEIIPNLFIAIKKFNNEPKILSAIYHIFTILLGKTSEVESNQLFGQLLQEFIETLTSTTEKVVDPSNPLSSELKILFMMLLKDETFNDYNERLESLNKKYLGSVTPKVNETSESKADEANPESVEVGCK